MHPQNPRRPVRRSGRPGQRRPVQAAPSSSPAKPLIIIGFVVAAIAGATFVAKRSGNHGDESPGPSSGSAQVLEVASVEPLEASTKPRDATEEDDFQTDEDPFTGANDFIPEPVGFVEPPGAAPEAAPESSAWDLKGQPARGVSKGAAPRAKTPAAGQENRFFTLVLSGTIGDRHLDPNDKQTWARLSYFLRDESPVKSYLVYPNGTIPISRPAVPGAAAAKPKQVQDDPSPVGDRTAPTYRLVIQSTAQSQGNVTFYGRSLGSKYGCKIVCRVEKRDGEKFKLLEQTVVEEAVTPTNGATIDPAAQVRQLHDAAIDSLTQKLQTMRTFRA